MATVHGNGSSRAPGVSGSRACPDPEALAAYIDGGVADSERAVLEAHLVGCDDCRFLIAQAIETHGAYDEMQVGGPGASQAAGPRAAGIGASPGHLSTGCYGNGSRARQRPAGSIS